MDDIEEKIFQVCLKALIEQSIEPDYISSWSRLAYFKQGNFAGGVEAILAILLKGLRENLPKNMHWIEGNTFLGGHNGKFFQEVKKFIFIQKLFTKRRIFINILVRNSIICLLVSKA